MEMVNSPASISSDVICSNKRETEKKKETRKEKMNKKRKNEKEKKNKRRKYYHSQLPATDRFRRTLRVSQIDR